MEIILEQRINLSLTTKEFDTLNYIFERFEDLTENYADAADYTALYHFIDTFKNKAP